MVRPGYKRTEVGEIPEDWDVRRLGDFHPFVTSGPRGWAERYCSDGATFLRITNLDRSRLEMDLADLRRVAVDSGDAEADRTTLANDDVLISITADIGAIGIVTPQVPKPAYVNQHLAVVRLDPRKVCPRLVALQLAAPRQQRLFRALTDAGAKAGINLQTVRQLQCPLPRQLHEQLRIAEVAIHVDALIESLEHLLAKKRAIKQGAMQSLLTGAKRLPGFTARWRTVPFGELARPRRDRVDPSHSETGIACIELEHIQPATGRLLGASTTHTGASLKSVFRPGDVLFGKLRAYLRKHWLADRHGCCSTEIWALAPVADAMVSQYLLQLVTTDDFIEAASTAYGTHMPRSDWRVVAGLQVSVPSPREQAAIAEVLADLDADLDATTAKLDKARALKQGMMQELLTGRIRLV